MNEFYYINKKNQAWKNIIQIIICIVTGVLLAGYVTFLMYGKIKLSIMLELFLIFVGLSYGLLKTWNSCLVLTSASSSIWIIWIFYLAIKLTIAIVYGIIGMPIILILSICDVMEANEKIREYNSMRQSNIYYNNNGYYGS